jgi:hypothetical protein
MFSSSFLAFPGFPGDFFFVASFVASFVDSFLRLIPFPTKLATKFLTVRRAHQ